MNKRQLRRGVQLVAALCVALLLVGCGMRGAVRSAAQQQMLQELAAGEAVLNCGGLCAATFIASRDEIWQRARSDDAEGLALAVMRTHWRQDISYFLLGIAAEKLGMLPAAERYYRFAGALATGPDAFDRCSTAPDGGLCGSYTFPQDIFERLTLVRRAIAGARAQSDTPGPPVADVSDWIDPPPVEH